MIDQQEIQPTAEPISGSIRPPGSKSLTNRALVCAAMADGQSTLTGVLRSEDTEVMVRCLEELGISIESDWEQQLLFVDGCGGQLPARSAELQVAGSGTTLRFLTALVASGQGRFTLSGNRRMCERPIDDLVQALIGCGVEVESTGNCPPVSIHANGLPGGRIKLRGDISSQYVSGLLLAAPAAQKPVDIEIIGPLVSRPYVEMTIGVMQSFGVEVTTVGKSEFHIAAPRPYAPQHYEIEPDASAASYFWAAAAITGGRVRVEGLSKKSLQGDIAFCECLQEMGCDVDYGDTAITLEGRSLHGIDIDMTSISDTVQTLSAVALFADGTTVIRGVGHIRHKETDRIADLSAELRKLGATVAEESDGLQITPGRLRGAAIETYNDHRMAMSLALVGLRVPGVTILDPACTKKTYPGFFIDLARLANQRG